MVIGRAKQKYNVLGRGPFMAKNNVKLTYTFINPNTPKVFENTLKKILIDKLLSNPPKPTFAKS